MKLPSFVKARALSATLAVVLFVPTAPAYAGAVDFLKGCVIMGGIGVGGTMMAASQSKVDLKDSQALVVSGVTSCLIGGLLANDTVKKAEMEASYELTIKNDKLKNRIYGVMHDLCVIKGTCGPDGLPLKKDVEQGTNGAEYYPYDINSGGAQRGAPKPKTEGLSTGN